MVIENNFLRYLLPRLAYLIMLVIVLSLLANVFAFFSHANYMQPEKKVKSIYSTSYHVPTTVWDQPQVANGRMLEQFDNAEITRAYQNAWYFLNESLRKKSTVGLEDFFADHLIEEIEKVITKDHDYIEDRVDLDHNIDLHLFSIDKQVAAFKDTNVRIKRKVVNKGSIVYEEEVYKNYEVVMTLADGKWKVLHLKEMENTIKAPDFKNEPRFVMDSIVTYVQSGESEYGKAAKVNCKTKPLKGYHKLMPGETLYRLSKKYNVSVKQMMKWNKIANLADIKACSHLRVVPQQKDRKKIVLVTPRVEREAKLKIRKVEKGESLFKIAKEYNLQPSVLKEANGIEDIIISEGQILEIPNLLEINRSKINKLKGINYYPQDTPWWDFWTAYDSKIIRKDLLTIKKLGMNTIRVFVPSDGVIPGLQFNTMLDKLESLLDECETLDLDVMVTLFDFPVSFDLSYYTKSERQLEGLLTRFKDHPALLAWDLKNEPDLDFKLHGKKKVIQWLSYLIEKARVYDPNHLLTIGWSNPESAINLSKELDFISYHYYREVSSLKLDMLKLREAVNNKPLVLQEFGIPSDRKWYKPLGYSKDDQSEYLSEFKKEMEANNLPYMLWTLYDFTDIPTEVFGHKRWATNKQKYFGLIDHDGKKKPSYYIFSPESAK